MTSILDPGMCSTSSKVRIAVPVTDNDWQAQVSGRESSLDSMLALLLLSILITVVDPSSVRRGLPHHTGTVLVLQALGPDPLSKTWKAKVSASA